MVALQSLTERHSLPLVHPFSTGVSSTNKDILLVPPTYCGKPVVFFVPELVQDLAKLFRFVLVGKFSGGRPSMATLTCDFLKIGYSDSFAFGLLDNRHFLIRFDPEKDYLHCCCQGFLTFQGFFMRIFNWLLSFSLDAESSIAPVWKTLDGLPAHLFHKAAFLPLQD
ncbi:hypothetical protein ACH5RR_026139 [Cinchona calisaya]|uniref:DUF4283 domain-containing protein n=1 Tax=Cinchona calisaya TaxID=153742 RepID=A0ABD2Z5N7_9GENT